MVMVEHSLYLLEKLFGDDRRDSVFDLNIFVAVNADVLIIEEYRSQAVLIELTSTPRSLPMT